VRATRTVVRPNRKNGGTTLIFRLEKPAVIRVTIFRVYPSCKRIGSFTFRGRRGVNRIRFRGRVDGRPLSYGGYRLVFRARGARRDAAAVPIVIAHGRMSPTRLHRARTTVVCNDQVADLGGGPADPPAGPNDSENGLLASFTKGVEKPISGVAGVIASTAKDLPARVKNAIAEKAPDDPFLLTMIGLLMLSIALLGAIVLAHVTRTIQRRY
jgi:hypothetical protein